MTAAERIVLTVIQAETAAAGCCQYEGLADRLADYLDPADADILCKSAGEAELLDAFLMALPCRAGIYLGIHGFRYGERVSEPGIRV